MYFGSLADLPENPLGFMFTLQETRSIHDYMNIPKIELISKIFNNPKIYDYAISEDFSYFFVTSTYRIMMKVNI